MDAAIKPLIEHGAQLIQLNLVIMLLVIGDTAILHQGIVNLVMVIPILEIAGKGLDDGEKMV